MTRDYAKPARKNHHGYSDIPTWVWFVTGFVSGFFVAFLVYLDGWVEKDTTAVIEAPVIETITSEVTASGDKIETIDFDFYDMFPNLQVPVVEEYTAEGEKVQIKEAAAYLLQVGSFLNKTDADKLRGKLLLLGLDVFSKEVEVKGKKYHRVLVGPLENVQQLNEKQQLLAEELIESLPLRIEP